MSQARRQHYYVEDYLDFDAPLEPDESDSEEVMNFERARYAPILAGLDKLEAELTRAEDETEHEMHREKEGIDEDNYLL